MPAFTRRTLLGTAAASAAATAVPLRRGRAQSAPIRIGILTDMSGPYAEATGPGDVLAAQFAIEDFTKQHPEIKVELLQADMLLKPDVGATIARGWYDTQDVDAIFDIPHSGVAIAVGQVAKEKDKAVIFTGAGIPDLTGKYCSPNQIQWTYDLWSNSNAVTRGLVQGGRDTWYFVKFDYISGHTMAKDTATIVEQMGGKVLGMSAYPFPGTTDFSSYLLAAQASKAKVLCLANAGDDTSNCIKQAREFGLPQGGMTICALVYQDYIVQSVGLDQAQGIVGCMPFVWTKDEGTRAFAARFMPRYHNAAPNYYHAGCYSALTHYLKAVAALGPDKAKASGRAAIAQMKAIPVDDPLFGKGHVRADGKHIHDTYVWQTKAPAESKGPWDFFNLVATIPAEKAFQPMDPQTCALAKA